VFAANNLAFIGKNLYFSENNAHRIAKISFPSNKAPTMTIPNFPANVVKNSSKYYPFDINDTDGFVSNIYCDFGDSKGDHEVFYDTYGTASSQTRAGAYIKYIKDGDYNVTCQIYDNEGLSSIYTKNFTLGTPTSKCTQFSVENSGQTVQVKLNKENYYNIKVCGDVQIFSSDESIATATRHKTNFIDEIKVIGRSEGNTTITIADANGVAHIFVQVLGNSNTAHTNQTTNAECSIALSNFQPYIFGNRHYVDATTPIMTNDGFSLIGSKWNNGCGAIKDDVCDGNMIISDTKCNFLGKKILTEFSVSSDGYAGYWLLPEWLHNYKYYNTNHSWAGGKVIPQNTQLFQELIIKDDGSWSATLHKDTIDGKILHTQTGQATNEQRKKLLDTNFIIMFGDNYSGVNSSMLIKSLSITNINGSQSDSTVSAALSDVQADNKVPQNIVDTNVSIASNTEDTGSTITGFTNVDTKDSKKIDVNLNDKNISINT